MSNTSKAKDRFFSSEILTDKLIELLSVLASRCHWIDIGTTSKLRDKHVTVLKRGLSSSAKKKNINRIFQLICIYIPRIISSSLYQLTYWKFFPHEFLLLVSGVRYLSNPPTKKCNLFHSDNHSTTRCNSRHITRAQSAVRQTHRCARWRRRRIYQTHQHMFVLHPLTMSISSFRFLNNVKTNCAKETLEIQKHLQAQGIRTRDPR